MLYTTRILLQCSYLLFGGFQADGRGGGFVVVALRLLGRGISSRAVVLGRCAVHARRELAGRSGRAAHTCGAALGWHRASRGPVVMSPDLSINAQSPMFVLLHEVFFQLSTA